MPFWGLKKTCADNSIIQGYYVTTFNVTFHFYLKHGIYENTLLLSDMQIFDLCNHALLFLLFWCYIKINHLFTLKNLASHFDLSLASMNIRLEREAYNAKKNCISRRFRGKHVRKIAKDVCKSSHNIKRACIKIKPPKCHSILTTSICYYYM